MTELELLRELADEAALPELTDLADARASLTRAIATERATIPGTSVRRARRVRRPRRTRPIVMGAAAAAAVGAVVFGVSFVINAHPVHSTARSVASAAPPRLPALAHPTGAQVLNRAAFVALHTATAAPSGDQFVYTRTDIQGGHSVQAWLSVDGARTSRIGTISMPGCVQGRMSLRAPAGASIITRSCTPQPAYFPGMPTRAARMLAYLERTQGVRSADLNDIAKTVGDLLDSDYLQPAQQAALYTFLARTPGITVKRDVTDAAGRPGVGVIWSFQGSQSMLIFDSHTYAYLGTSTRGIDGQLSGAALITKAIVDSVGLLPGTVAMPGSTDGA